MFHCMHNSARADGNLTVALGKDGGIPMLTKPRYASIWDILCSLLTLSMIYKGQKLSDKKSFNSSFEAQ